METRKTPLLPNRYYHIYNRGINGQNIFVEQKNYSFFLKKYAQFVSPYTDTYAYCLLKNHFHFLIKTKSEEDTMKIVMPSLEAKASQKSVSWHLSNSFGSLFKSYAQAFNKRYSRTGGLFEEPFHRIEVDDDAYFSKLLWYIHFNPQKHGFVKDFREYEHSSYRSHLLERKTKLNRTEVLNWFGNKDAYIQFHLERYPVDKIMNKFVIEFD